jgi:Leucine-rich repeat (LRR) protein
VLYLINNDLRELPPEIGQLSNLRSLSLEDNGLRELPLEIGQLTRLQIIDVSGNPLVSPPPEIVTQGDLAIIGYLQEEWARREAEKQRLLLMGVSGVGLLAALVLGFRLKQRGQRKPKQKR